MARANMLQAMCKSGGHFTPEELQEALASEGHAVALTTVYRNLPVFEQAGIIRRVSVLQGVGGGGVVWEHVWGKPHHDHLVCVECGKRVEFVYPALEVLQEAVAAEYGFELTNHHMELMGRCPGCAASKEKST